MLTFIHYLINNGLALLDDNGDVIILGEDYSMPTDLNTLGEPPDCLGFPLVGWVNSFYHAVVEAIANIAVNNPVGVEVGDVLATARTTKGAGWLMCYGQAVSRTTYADLFAVVGVQFGAGDGSTTFNIPDLRGRAIVGKDNMGGTSANRITGAWADSLGGSAGAEYHVLVNGEIPIHNHAGRMAATDSGSGSHFRFPVSFEGFDIYTPPSGAIIYSDNYGGGSAHNNVQPSMTLNKFIYAGT